VRHSRAEGAFEREFTLSEGSITPGPPFTVKVLRVVPRFKADLAEAPTPEEFCHSA
jgi:hypothetical protein